jgi:hypothetical protein
MKYIRPPSLAALLIIFSTAVNGQEQQGADDLTSPLDQTVPVADEQPAAEPEQITEQPLTEDALLIEFTRFRELLEDRNYDEADISA